MPPHPDGGVQAGIGDSMAGRRCRPSRRVSIERWHTGSASSKGSLLVAPDVDIWAYPLLHSGMGFRAPSSEEVYRYMLRLDDRERTLTDRFGWSILLVSDYSWACRDFLSEYCLDLCARTADRVRFVFFSGMPASEFEEIALRLKNDNTSPDGLLGAVLRKLGFSPWEPRLDFEDRYWNDLRPASLRPFSDISEIERHLDRQCRAKTAMPGSQEGLRFAQRLGIGRHVPCILVFTDIGDLTVHVLPFNGRSAADVYQHVRSWIDSYYELNRDELNTWNSVERRIKDLAANAERSLRTVRDWPSECRRNLRALRWVAELAQTLSDDQDAAAEQLAALPAYVPWELSGTLQGFNNQFAEFDRQSAASLSLIAKADALATHVEVEDIRRDLTKLTRERPSYLRPPAEAVVRKSLLMVQGPRPPALRPGEYAEWWQRSAGLIFSKGKFLTERSAWRAIAHAGRRETESIAEHKRRDYAAFWAVAGAEPVAGDPAAAVNEIMAQLAKHYEVSASSQEWVSATNSFRRYLAAGLDWLQATAPECLSRPSVPLLIRECIAPGNQESPSLLHLFGPGEKWGGPVRWAEPSPPTAGLSVRHAYMAGSLQQRDLVCQVLREEARHLALADSDRRSAFEALATYLQGARADLEMHALTQAPAGKIHLAGEEEIATITELDDLLDKYQQAVERIVYPHGAIQA
jgi:hypothetical protein